MSLVESIIVVIIIEIGVIVIHWWMAEFRKLI